MTYEPRRLDERTLSGLANYYCEEFKSGTRMSRDGKRFLGGPTFVVQDMHRLDFKDEFEFVRRAVETTIDTAYREKFQRKAAEVFEPRREDVFERLLLEKLAIRPDGTHVEGAIGKVQLGNRVVGKRVKEVPRYHRFLRTTGQRLTLRNGTVWDRLLFRSRTSPRVYETRFLVKNEYWPVYAGEVEERLADSGVADPLPEGAMPWSSLGDVVLATNPQISNEAILLALDAIVDQLDEGSTAANIRGRTGSQPAGADASETGTLLFTLVMSDPAFGNAADDNPGGIATASSITDDSSADATGTLGYCRIAATGTGADDHIDGEAGTSGSDFNFNTLSIASGATVSMTSLTVSLPEGA